MQDLWGTRVDGKLRSSNLTWRSLGEAALPLKLKNLVLRCQGHTQCYVMTSLTF